MTKRTITGIDLGTQTTRVAVGEYRKGAKIPRIIGTGTSESKGLRHGYVINPNEAIKGVLMAVREAERAAGVKIKRALIAIGGLSLESITSQGSTIISKADGEITEIDIKAVIESSEENLKITNKKIIHTIPLSFKIDGKEVMGRPLGMRGIKLEVKTMFITSLEQHLNDLIQIIEEAGIEVEDIVASPVAASFVTLNKQQKTAGCILANIGSETVTTVVYENNIPISLKVFPIGSTDITNDIALGFKIPLEEAEQAKLGKEIDSYPKKKLEDIIEARLSDIFELIESHLKKIGRNGLLPAGIVITGGGSGIATIEDLARASLKLPSKIAELESFNGNKNKIKDSAWAVAYGLTVLGNSYLSEDSESLRLVKNTKSNLTSWLKQFLP